MSKSILNHYVDTMCQFLSKVHNQPPETFRPALERYVTDNYKNPKIKIAKKNKNGDMELVDSTLLQYIGENANNIMSPSGSVYVNTDTKESVLSQMITRKLADRKIAKNKMFECKSKGDTLGARKYNSEQSSIKININSAIGAMGQETNVFSNKSGFNSVTAFARSLIAHAYTTTEQLLGGNFYLPNSNLALNHLTVLSKYVNENNIDAYIICDKFKLQHPSKEQVKRFIISTIEKYSMVSMRDVEFFIDSLNQNELDFIFYFRNLKNLICENSTMTNWFRELLSADFKESAGDIELSCMDEDLTMMLDVWMCEEIKDNDGYTNIRKLIGVDDATVGRYKQLYCSTKSKLEKYFELFDTFIFPEIGISMIHEVSKTSRTATVESDTDSVIFTTSEWVQLFGSGNYAVDHTGYMICSLMTYFLTKNIFYGLEQFSLRHGSSMKYKNMMKMKNEFLYPVMITYGTKKVYCALTACQEGLMYNTLVPDIKGVALRSSNVCTEASAFKDHFIVDSILRSAMNGSINPSSLIKEVIDFEQSIFKSLVSGESTYLKITSIKEDKQYKDPMSSQWAYWFVWEQVFAEEYGNIYLPDKTPIVDLDTKLITQEYLSWLATKFPKTYSKMKIYIETYGKFPGFLAINPDTRVIPDEIKPLISYKDIVYHSMSSVYLTMEQLGITTWNKKKKIMFSDMYPDYVASAKRLQ